MVGKAESGESRDVSGRREQKRLPRKTDRHFKKGEN
jgi:hypothetical protein